MVASSRDIFRSREATAELDGRHRIIPFRKLTPTGCSELARIAEEAILAFEQWGVRVPTEGRLRVAIRHLRWVSTAGSYGSTPAELLKTSRAIVIAGDFYQIALTLDPDLPGGEMGNELTLSLAGALEEGTLDTTAYELHTQLWFGMLLAKSGLRPRIPKKIVGKTPDFIITCDTLEFGVEVKRPRTLEGAFRALSQAGKQVRACGLPGMIALDLSECFRSVALTTGVMDSGHKAVDLVRPHFRREVKNLHSYVSSYTRSDKFFRVSLLACYVRLAAWDSRDLSEPDLDILGHVKVFNTACHGLVIQQGERIQDLVGRGILSFGRIGPPRRIHNRCILTLRFQPQSQKRRTVPFGLNFLEQTWFY